MGFRPKGINVVTFLEGLWATFHNVDNCVLRFCHVEATEVLTVMSFRFLVTGNNLLRIAEDRDVWIVCRNDELDTVFIFDKGFNDVAVYRFVI